MYKSQIASDAVMALADSELDLVSGGWSASGMLGAAVAGAVVGAATGVVAGGVGAGPGAVLGAAAGAVSYNIQHIFED
jgi:uncharacterized membrane protein